MRSRKASPISVSAMRRVVRFSSRAPRWVSRSAISRVTTAGARSSARAAAAKPPSSFTRAEVKADVLVAAAMHRLLPAGEYERVAAPSARFAVSRAQVKADTLSARAAGTLLPAGEIIDGARTAPTRAGATNLAGR